MRRETRGRRSRGESGTGGAGVAPHREPLVQPNLLFFIILGWGFILYQVSMTPAGAARAEQPAPPPAAKPARAGGERTRRRPAARRARPVAERSSSESPRKEEQPCGRRKK